MVVITPQIELGSALTEQQAREIFGQFLRNWRKANGWVVTTPQDWAKACPDICPAVDPEACTEAATPNHQKQPRRSERI